MAPKVKDKSLGKVKAIKSFFSGKNGAQYIADSCSEFVRLAKLAATIVPGSVEAPYAAALKHLRDSAEFRWAD